MRFLSHWFGEVLGISTLEFKSQYGFQSGRNGGSSATANACIPLELWGQHSDWTSFKKSKMLHEKM